MRSFLVCTHKKIYPEFKQDLAFHKSLIVDNLKGVLMNELNERFLSNLFIQKRVRCHQDVYNKAFHLIWPCEEYFKEFLSCSVTDLKYELAKKIYEHLRAFEDVILPAFTIDNVIALQLKQLAVSNKGYVAQDHVIHSINLYILGIYLFFNFPLFHKKILLKDSADKTVYTKIATFIKKWKAFALYHDVGYFFESNIDCSGNASTEVMPLLREYKMIYTYLLYEYVTRSVARTIITVAIIQRSKRTFSNKMIDFALHKYWKRGNAAASTSETVEKVLNIYKNEVIVDDIQSDIAFAHFDFVLEKQNVLMIIYDKDDYTIGFVERAGNEIKNIFVEKDSVLDKSEIYSAENCEMFTEKIPIDCSLKYCIKDAAKAAYLHLQVDVAECAKGYYRQLPERLRLQLALATTDSQINQCYFDIYRWLIEKAGEYLCTEQPIPEHYIFEQSIETYYKVAINSRLSNYIYNTVKDIKHIKSGDIEKILGDIAKSITKKERKTELSKAIRNEAAQQYKAEEGVPHNMITYYAQTYHQILHEFVYSDAGNSMDSDKVLAKELEALQFMHVNSENKIEISIFQHGNQRFEVELYERIAKLAENLQINFNELIAYSTNYSNSDHGLISAGLLYQATIFSHYLAQFSANQNEFKLAAWHGLSAYLDLISGECVNDYAEVIFAILLHNIYTRESALDYGIDYRHNIDDDAFSYFCAFCDTFQTWHRPKQLDISKTNLPDKNFLSDEFELSVEEDKICLKCSMQDAGFLRKKLIEDNKFLPGILHFVHIKEY